jgi:hypothetical protein
MHSQGASSKGGGCKLVPAPHSHAGSAKARPLAGGAPAAPAGTSVPLVALASDALPAARAGSLTAMGGNRINAEAMLQVRSGMPQPFHWD